MKQRKEKGMFFYKPKFSKNSNIRVNPNYEKKNKNVNPSCGATSLFIFLSDNLDNSSGLYSGDQSLLSLLKSPLTGCQTAGQLKQRSPLTVCQRLCC